MDVGLVDPSSHWQTARDASRDRPIEALVAQRAQKRQQLHIVIVDATEAAQQRVELFPADVDVAVPSAPVVDVVIEIQDVLEGGEDAAACTEP